MTPRDEIYNIISKLIESGVEPCLSRVRDLYVYGGDTIISEEQLEDIYKSFFGENGYKFFPNNSVVQLYQYDDLLKDGKIKFGVVSDTHIGSRYHDNKFLHEVYDWFEEEGVDTVLHCGDVIDGYGVYPGQQNTLVEINIGEQAKLCADIYPRKKNIETYFITGNHDLKQFEKASGIDPGIVIEKEREDMHYLGRYAAEIYVGDVAIRMIHLSGGASYAKSYPGQKYLRDFDPEIIPDILLLGHLHNYNKTLDKGCHTFLLPSFLMPNDLSVRTGMENYVGGIIVEIYVNSDGNIICVGDKVRYKHCEKEIKKKVNIKRIVRRKKNG